MLFPLEQKHLVILDNVIFQASDKWLNLLHSIIIIKCEHFQAFTKIILPGATQPHNGF